MTPEPHATDAQPFHQVRSGSMSGSSAVRLVGEIVPCAGRAFQTPGASTVMTWLKSRALPAWALGFSMIFPF